MKYCCSVLTLVALVAILATVRAYPAYRQRIPNGFNVPDPCNPGTIWYGVGHLRKGGGGPVNSFGADFYRAGHVWTPALCQADSDGDGLTNGQELGDPDCVWTSGAAPARTDGITHPGIAEGQGC